jgi:lipoprotein-releasing system ATP-binding protein
VRPAPTAMSSTPILACVDLQKTYSMGRVDVPVLNGITLEVRQGEVLGLVGASGAGKSTLLHLLGLLDVPTSGAVYLRGEDVSSKGGQRRSTLRNRELGFVFQFYHLIPELTALGNTILPAMVAPRPWTWMLQRGRERARARALLARLGLSTRLTHLPSQLSGGERQRIAIARALLGDPSVVFCDEPTGNLDSRTGQEIMDLLFEINRDQGTTFVIVSHDDRLVRRCHRVARLADGSLEGIYTPGVVAAPSSSS